MRELTVGAGFVRGLMRLAVSKGASEHDLAQRAEINPQDLLDQDKRIPFRKYVALMRAAKLACSDPALGLHYGEAVDVSEISIVGLLGRASETMVDAFAQLKRYARLIVEVEVVSTNADDRFAFSREGDQVWLVDTRMNPNDFPELTESAFAHIVCSTRHLGDTPFAKAVQVTHADPGYRAEYERIFQAPVAFDCPRNALRLDPTWLAKRFSNEPRYVFGILSAHAQALLTSLEDTPTTRGQVESLLMPILHTGNASVDLVATKLGLSRQTLFRRLKAEDVTFQQVLDDLRHKLALHYLGGKKVSVNETAYLVGFSDPAAFSRAFKRWTGASPRLARGRD
jgi:AraC-like DNA-binding protein